MGTVKSDAEMTPRSRTSKTAILGTSVMVAANPSSISRVRLAGALTAGPITKPKRALLAEIAGNSRYNRKHESDEKTYRVPLWSTTLRLPEI